MSIYEQQVDESSTAFYATGRPIYFGTRDYAPNPDPRNLFFTHRTNTTGIPGWGLAGRCSWSFHLGGVTVGLCDSVMVEDPLAATGGRTVSKDDPIFDSYQYVCERYSSQNSDLKYKADAHRSDYVLKLDTKEYTKAKVKLDQAENTTDTPSKK